jgi:hypothetical protein
MNEKQQFQLIDGTFTPAEAAEVLLSLVKSKMDYHKLDRLSHKERSGKRHTHSEHRLRSLTKLNGELQELFAAAAASNRNLKVNGWIEVSFE